MTTKRKKRRCVLRVYGVCDWLPGNYLAGDFCAVKGTTAGLGLEKAQKGRAVRDDRKQVLLAGIRKPLWARRCSLPPLLGKAAGSQLKAPDKVHGHLLRRKPTSPVARQQSRFSPLEFLIGNGCVEGTIPELGGDPEA